MTALSWVDANGTVWPIDGTATEKTLLGVVGLEMPPFAWSLQSIVSGDGALIAQQRKDVRPVSLPILLQVDGGEDLHARVRAFAAAFAAAGTLRYEHDEITSELRSVIYESGWEGVRSGETALGNWRKFTLNLLATDPWWYGDAASVQVPLNAATSFDAAVAFDDADTSFDGESAINFTVTGDTDALAVTTITGPFTTCRVTLSGGTYVELAATLASGDVITVDSRPGRRGPRLNGGAIDWSLLTDDSRLLKIPKGAATLSAGFSGDDANSSIDVSYEPRSLTPW